MCGSAITQVTRFLGTNPQSSIVMVGEVLISKEWIQYLFLKILLVLRKIGRIRLKE